MYIICAHTYSSEKLHKSSQQEQRYLALRTLLRSAQIMYDTWDDSPHRKSKTSVLPGDTPDAVETAEHLEYFEVLILLRLVRNVI